MFRHCLHLESISIAWIFRALQRMVLARDEDLNVTRVVTIRSYFELSPTELERMALLGPNQLVAIFISSSALYQRRETF